MLKDTLQRDMQAGTDEKEDRAPHHGGSSSSSGDSSSGGEHEGGGDVEPGRAEDHARGRGGRPRGVLRGGGCWGREVLARTLLKAADQLAQVAGRQHA